MNLRLRDLETITLASRPVEDFDGLKLATYYWKACISKMVFGGFLLMNSCRFDNQKYFKIYLYYHTKLEIN